MKFYLAPMEGVTGFIFRNAYEKHFGSFDTYFAPFIVPNQSKSLKTKELRDILPENNEGAQIVPQILTNDSEGFKITCEKFRSLGYNEVNLNLGCPSGTVTGKGKGSGFLAKKDALDKFLDEIYKLKDMDISIKTRIGYENAEEFYELIDIYNKYPLKELIIHPRTRSDFYKNTPNLEIFSEALKLSKASVCYNGDIFTKADYEKVREKFPNLNKVMLARGILANPGLLSEIKGEGTIDKKILKAFHDDIFNGYRETFKDDRNAMFRMKELWGYMAHIFEDGKKYTKKIRKAQKIDDYRHAVTSIFTESDIIKGAGLFSGDI